MKEEKENSKVVMSVNEIAEAFEIPHLADIIGYGQKVSLDMSHISGWIEEDGERFHVMPNIEFHPLEERIGFQILSHHAHLDEDGNNNASVWTFEKRENGYLTELDQQGDVKEALRVWKDDLDEPLEELEIYPLPASMGPQDPFKELGYE